MAITITYHHGTTCLLYVYMEVTAKLMQRQYPLEC